MKWITKILCCLLIALPLSTKPNLDTKAILRRIRLLQRRTIKPPVKTEIDTSSQLTPTEMAQTQAFLSLYKKEVQRRWKKDIKKYDSIIQQCMHREQYYFGSYYVFYHGQPDYLRLIHDFVQEIYEFIHVLQPLSDFIFLRPWYNALDKADVDHFIRRFSSDYPSEKMLCVNLSLYGNLHDSACCTFEYFKGNYAHRSPCFRSILEEIFNKLEFKTSFINELINIGKLMHTQEGTLAQIFIPKGIVDKCVYLSYAGATPHSSCIDPSCYSQSEGRHIKISPILEQYRQNPHSIQSDLDSLQARIIISQDIMLNPQSNVKIFTYNTVSPQKEQEYKQKLKELCDQIFLDWMQQNDIQNNHLVQQTQLANVLRKLSIS